MLCFSFLLLLFLFYLMSRLLFIIFRFASLICIIFNHVRVKYLFFYKHSLSLSQVSFFGLICSIFDAFMLVQQRLIISNFHDLYHIMLGLLRLLWLNWIVTITSECSSIVAYHFHLLGTRQWLLFAKVNILLFWF